MKKVVMVKTKEILPYDIEMVWNTVTDNTHYHWRTDLAHVQICDNGRKFIEYYSKGGYTLFNITARKKCQYYSFQMENKSFSGAWRGVFSTVSKGKTKVIFEERIFVKRFLQWFVIKYFNILKRMQKAYLSDLKKALADCNAGY